MPRVTFVEINGALREVDVAPGSTVLEAAKAHDLPLAGTCGGSMVCATCHVMIEAEDRAKLPPPSEDEENTLDLAFGVTADSRLGCQIKLTDAMHGIRIRLTSTMHQA
ncbi:MAG: 2Fe-2S iron-sulfur cluster binding domain-containing protein [Betaproteobacteria bacterium]|nr:2Fe-2S iron-sulfur cluster binding domain-containing protein [Betaproteobacteria bacterium]